MAVNLEFKEYLESITRHYAQWWKPYAFMDEIDNSTWFEFELNSNTQDKSREPGGKPEEKTQLVLEAIANYAHEKILIVGKPGAGKSTLLAKVAWQSVQQAKNDKFDKAQIPVLVELKSYQSTGDRAGIRGLILSSLEKHDPSLDGAALQQLLIKKRLLLLADGINELPDERAKKELKDFCLNVPLIATSRYVGSEKIDRKLELQPPSSSQVARFFEERLPNCDRARLRELGDRVKDLGQTPLMIWMLYSIFRAKNEIPETRGEAYRVFTTLYANPTKDEIDLADSRTMLSKLAFAMMQSRKADDPTDFRFDIFEIEAQTLLGSEKVLTYLVDRHLLQGQGEPGNQIIRFCHQSLQEYYAAEGLGKRLRDLSKSEFKKQLHQYLNYLKWTESIALMLGFPEITETQALEVVRSALEVDLRLGARLAGEVKWEFQPHAVSDTMQKFSRDFPKEPSWLKLNLLRQIGKAAIYELIPLLDDPSPSIRYHAYRTLRFIAPEEIPEQCRAREDFNWNPQRLERNPESLEPEEPLIQQDSDSSVSREVTEASHTIDSQAIALGLLKVMMSHPESFVRYEAVLGLGELSRKDDIAKFLSETHLQELVQQLEDSYIYTRWSIALMLWNIASEEVIPLLRPKLDHSNPDIALSAALILGKFGCSAAVPRLVEMMDYSNLSNHPNVQDISYLAGYALGQVKDNVTSEYLPKLLTLVSTQSGADVFQAIASIQERCKYYNHEIFQSLSEPEESNLPVTRSETSITYEIGQVGIFNAGNVTIEGDQKG